MSQPATLEVAGLQLSNNTFSASPPGSLAKADNVVISAKGVAQPRNGQAYQAVMPVALDLPFALTEFQQNIICNYALSKLNGYGLGYVNGGVINGGGYAGTFSPVGEDGSSTSYARMHFAQAAQYLHFCCTTGPKALETYNGTPRMAGLSRMPDPFAWPLGAGAVANGAVIPYNSSVAYRTILRRDTTTGAPLLSPVSNRAVATNRLLVPVGSLVRTGGNLVTATLLSPNIAEALVPGDAFTLAPGEANFAAGGYTIASVSISAQAVLTITFNSNGANASNTVAQDLNVGTLAVRVDSYLPATAQTGDKLRVYRSVATSDASIEPSDDLYLANEVKLTAGNIAAGFVTVQDNTPQSVINDPLYTNPSDGDGFGLIGSNFQPPIYGDITNFDGQTWYLNSQSQHSLAMQILGLGTPNGVQNGDTLTISDGVNTSVVTFKTTPAGALDCQIYLQGTPSQNIAMTSAYLAEFVGPHLLANGWGIYTETSPNGFPGRVRIERWDFGPQFNVKASRSTSWTPALDPSVATLSSNNPQANGLWNSKAQQPEVVPTVNFRNVGNPSYYGRRCFGLRNALIILKEGDGIWSLTGTAGNYALVQISTANIIAPDCACVFADCVWVYTDQGILRVTDSSGAAVISRPIETQLNDLATLYPAETYAWSFAVPYETERRVMFFVPFSSGTGQGGSPQLQGWCYSLATNTWTGPFYIANATITCGLVSSAKKLWLGTFDTTFSTGRLTIEQKTATCFDLADGGWANTLTTTANPLVVALTTKGAIQKGSGVVQTSGGVTYRAKVAAVLGGGLYQLSETMPWVNAACTIYDPYVFEPQFLPQGDPAMRKALTRLVTLYKPQSFGNLYGVVTVQTDQVPDELQIPATFPGYGLTPYGQGGYGNPSPQTLDSNPIDRQWANAGQFFIGFRMNEVWPTFKLQGLAAMLETAGGPVGRGK